MFSRKISSFGELGKRIKKEFKNAASAVTSVESSDNNKPAEEWIWVDGYKATDKDMKCRGYQYKLNEVHDMPADVEIRDCESGFHLCKYLADVFDYYPTCNGNRYFKVKALVRKSDYTLYGMVQRDRFGCALISNKLVSKSIIFISEVSKEELYEDMRGIYRNLEGLPDEYLQMAINTSIDDAVLNYHISILTSIGLSPELAHYYAANNKVDIKLVEALATQEGISMDTKLLILMGGKR